MATKEEDWKERAQAAEAELAERVIKDFDQKLRELVGGTAPVRSRIGRALVAIGELLDSSVPTSALGPALDRWNAAMVAAGASPSGTKTIADVAKDVTAAPAHWRCTNCGFDRNGASVSRCAGCFKSKVAKETSNG